MNIWSVNAEVFHQAISSSVNTVKTMGDPLWSFFKGLGLLLYKLLSGILLTGLLNMLNEERY